MITVKGYLWGGVVEYEKYPDSPCETNEANVEIILPDGWTYEPIGGDIFNKAGDTIMWIEEAKNKKYLKAHYMDEDENYKWTKLQYKNL